MDKWFCSMATPHNSEVVKTDDFYMCFQRCVMYSISFPENDLMMDHQNTFFQDGFHNFLKMLEEAFAIVLTLSGK